MFLSIHFKIQYYRQGTVVSFKQGIINKEVNWHLNYVPLPVDPKGFLSPDKYTVLAKISVHS